MPDTSAIAPIPDDTASDRSDALKRQRVALAALVAGALAIAFAPIFVRLSEVGPTTTAFWRILLSLPALWIWLALEPKGGSKVPKSGSKARKPTDLSDHLRLTGAGLFFAADLAVWHWSLNFTSVTNSTLLANFAPIFVTLVSWLVFKERFTRTFVTGLALAVGGAVVLMGRSFQVSPEHLFGDALGLLTAAFYGGYILSVGRLRAEFSTATIMTWSGVVTAAALLPVALLSGETLFLYVSHVVILYADGVGLAHHLGRAHGWGFGALLALALMLVCGAGALAMPSLLRTLRREARGGTRGATP